MPAIPDYTISPLGDCALLLDFGEVISKSINEKVVSLFYMLQENPLPGMTEAVSTYSSIAVYYDAGWVAKECKGQGTAYKWMCGVLQQFLEREKLRRRNQGKLAVIPVCYEGDLAPDIEWVAAQHKISKEEVVRIHTAKPYRVYMIGFLPGFAYLGGLDPRLASPRKPKPATVEEGSIALGGQQTGIYPFRSPGGWQIIGRTPLKMFDTSMKITSGNPSLLQAGDTVQFTSITRDEFENIKGRRS